MARRADKRHIEWYGWARAQYDALGATVSSTLQTLLRQSSIDFLSVSHRAKSHKSFAEKLSRKRYANPILEMTDLAGIRVITYIERDIEKVADAVRDAFQVHDEYSVDKSSSLAADQFGYRSVHLVCDIGPTRARLPELSAYLGMKFEIQVRTVLQHAWAEIEHDRSYKFSGQLPSQLKRRFHLVAGLLELADREFNVLTEEIERYEREVEKSTRAGDLQIKINFPSVMQFAAQKLSALRKLTADANASYVAEVMDELEAFGIHSLAELDKLLGEQFLSDLNRHIKSRTHMGVLRDAMMYHDIDRYFRDAWNNHWQGWDGDVVDLMSAKYGSQKIKQIMRDFDLDHIPPDSYFGEPESKETAPPPDAHF